MKNFRRVLRLALQHRWNVLGCVVTAVCVAVLWAANLSAVFPVVDVIMTDRALPEWVDDQLADHESKAADHQAEIDSLEKQLAEASADKQASLRLQSDLLENKHQLQLHGEAADK